MVRVLDSSKIIICYAGTICQDQVLIAILLVVRLTLYARAGGTFVNSSLIWLLQVNFRMSRWTVLILMRKEKPVLTKHNVTRLAQTTFFF